MIGWSGAHFFKINVPQKKTKGHSGLFEQKVQKSPKAVGLRPRRGLRVPVLRPKASKPTVRSTVLPMTPAWRSQALAPKGLEVPVLPRSGKGTEGAFGAFRPQRGRGSLVRSTRLAAEGG